MGDIRLFTNNYHHILEYIHDSCIKDNTAYITQQEIADELQLSRATVNEILRELRERGYVIRKNSHSARYTLTSIALHTIKSFRNANKLQE